MFDKRSAMTLIQESLDSLFRSKTIKTQLIAKDELILMGTGTEENLDSLGFVNFIMDVEERLENVIDSEASITLTDIEGFNVNNPVLTTGVLANHLVYLAN